MNNYNIGVVIPEAGTLEEIPCPAKRDSMLKELFTTLGSRVIEKRQIDDEKDRQGSVKYLGSLAEETETRIYAGLSMTNHAHLLFWRKQKVIQLSQQRLLIPL